MASKYDTANIKTFDNQVLETKLENQLITKLNMNQFITMDYSLTEAPGMKKVVRTYVGTGNVEDLAMGAGNSGAIGSEYSEAEYEVVTTQGHVPFYDEQRMNDPVAIDKAIQHLAEALTNDVTTKIVAELDKGTGTLATLDFDGVVDAIAEYPDEEASGLYLLMAKDAYADLQKACKDELKYVDGYIDENTFQWETVANVNERELNSLKNSKKIHIFVRKVDNEDGIQLPFTYIGSGKMEYIEGSRKSNGAHLFRIPMEKTAPEDIYFDFKLPG